MTFRRPSVTAITSYVFFTASIGIAAFSVMMLANVDVLSNWRLVLPEGKIQAGDTVVIQSYYEKKMEVTGVATRYIECKTDKGFFVRYPVSSAVANRPPGVSATGIVVEVPDVIPDLPATCKFSIAIEYEVLKFRRVVESNSSPEFLLLPAKVAPAVSEQAHGVPQ